jgi:hypothetical protein
MVQQALEGYNGCIMCYGQTGERERQPLSHSATRSSWGDFLQHAPHDGVCIKPPRRGGVGGREGAPGLNSWWYCAQYYRVCKQPC